MTGIADHLLDRFNQYDYKVRRNLMSEDTINQAIQLSKTGRSHGCPEIITTFA